MIPLGGGTSKRLQRDLRLGLSRLYLDCPQSAIGHSPGCWAARSYGGRNTRPKRPSIPASTQECISGRPTVSSVVVAFAHWTSGSLFPAAAGLTGPTWSASGSPASIESGWFLGRGFAFAALRRVLYVEPFGRGDVRSIAVVTNIDFFAVDSFCLYFLPKTGQICT